VSNYQNFICYTSVVHRSENPCKRLSREKLLPASQNRRPQLNYFLNPGRNQPGN